MKILLTGSHFTPAQALIEVLKEKKISVVYIGRKNTLEGDSADSVESKILPKDGVKFLPLFTGRLQRDFSLSAFFSLLKIPIGFIQSFIYILQEKPDAVVSFGGYVGFPVVFCSWLLSIPVLVHEQTLVSGLSNKLSSIFAKKIAVSFIDHELLKNKKAFFTGNPIRKEVLNTTDPSLGYKDFIEKAIKEKKKILLVTGGNQGSHFINDLIFKLLTNLLKKYAVIHQTGDSKFRDFEKLDELGKSLDGDSLYLLSKWIEVKDWSYCLREADLVIGRAGINTLFELTYLTKKAIIIPIPYIYKDEQIKNSSYFAKFGFIDVILQKDATPAALLLKIEKNLNKKIKVVNLDLGQKDAARKLALETMLLAQENEI